MVAATGTGSVLTLNNSTVCMNPGAFTGNFGEPWGGPTAYSTGELDVVLVPGVQDYAMLVDTVTAGLFEVQADGTPNPGAFLVNIGGVDYTITLDAGFCNTPPTAEAGGPYEVEVGQQITLDGSSSSDPENNIVNYEWDFDYDGVTFDVEAIGATPSFNATGFVDEARNIALRVVDAGGLSDIDTATVAIQALPVASIDSIAGLLENSSVDVLASATHPTPNEVLVFAYEVLFEGTPVATDSGVGLTNFSFTTSDNGDFEIVLAVTDENGDADAVSQTITIDNVAPTATLNVIQVDDALAQPEVTIRLEDVVDASSDLHRFSFALSTDDLADSYATANDSNESLFSLPVDSTLVIYARVFDDDGGSTTYSLNTIVGTSGSDTISGTSSRDLLIGLGGSDTISAGSGADFVYAGAGADIVNGERGDDYIDLGAGNDTLEVRGSRAEFDTMIGGPGIDKVVNIDPTSDLQFHEFLSTINELEELAAAGVNVRGNGQANTLDFANAKLTAVAGVFGGNGADNITASNVTHDVVYDGQGGDDTLVGNSKRDQLFGGNGADTINAGGSADIVDGGQGIDIIDLGAGNDTLQVNSTWAEFDQVQGSDGTDKVVNTDPSKDLRFNEFLSTSGSLEELDAAGVSVLGNGQPNTLDFSNAQLTAVSGVFAGNGVDTITASANTHDIAYHGQGGNDVLTGLGRRDQLFGGNGADIINAGGAGDIVDGGQGSDTIDLGPGNDTLQINDNWAEFDVMIGGEGTDKVVNTNTETDIRLGEFLSTLNSLEELDAAGRSVLGNGQDNVLDFANATLTLVAGVFAESGADTLTASGFTHDIAYYGQGGDDVLTGLGRRDQLFGDDGDDIINAGGAPDIVNGGRGMDTIDLSTGDDTLQVNSNWAEFDVMVGGDGFDSVVNVDAGTDLRFNAFLSTLNSLEELDAAGTNVDRKRPGQRIGLRQRTPDRRGRSLRRKWSRYDNGV